MHSRPCRDCGDQVVMIKTGRGWTSVDPVPVADIDQGVRAHVVLRTQQRTIPRGDVYRTDTLLMMTAKGELDPDAYIYRVHACP